MQNPVPELIVVLKLQKYPHLCYKVCDNATPINHIFHKEYEQNSEENSRGEDVVVEEPLVLFPLICNPTPRFLAGTRVL